MLKALDRNLPVTFLADESGRLKNAVDERRPVVRHVTPRVTVTDDVILHVRVDVVHTRTGSRLSYYVTSSTSTKLLS